VVLAADSHRTGDAFDVVPLLLGYASKGNGLMDRWDVGVKENDSLQSISHDPIVPPLITPMFCWRPSRSLGRHPDVRSARSVF